jgi:hypothetical protein
MTKLCQNCGHKKGEHTFYRVSNEEGLFSSCKKCKCIEFRELKGASLK